jgi:hypothetical protein
MKTLIKLGTVALAVWVTGCGPQTRRTTHADIIRAALSRLMARPVGAFLIVEDPGSGKFVQFAGSEREPLMLDLPAQVLSSEEMARAKAVFREFGHPGPETYETRDRPGGPPTGTRTSFVVAFGRDVDKATELAVAVLHRIYGIREGAPLKLTEE